MVFNSLAFILFFPVVVAIYWLLPTQKMRTGLLVLASLYFYMSWKPVFGLLLLASVGINYVGGLMAGETSGSGHQTASSYRRVAATVAIVLDVCLLACFKYANFLGDIFNSVFTLTGLPLHVPGLDILLPLGISFFTFKGISYVVDVYRGTIQAERDVMVFAAYLTFFPQLIAGPIDRAGNLIPQLREKQTFDGTYLTAGAKMMLWGYFMKVVFANRAAIYVDAIYGNMDKHNGTSLLLAAVLYSMQIYCDFAGYSLISIGCARAMGIRVPDNFVRPYLAVSISDFWKRWHVSLTRWFTDYVYIPLGGNRCSKWRNSLNIMIVFLLSGLWHGSAWNYVIWGAIHGVLQVVEKRLGLTRKKCQSAVERIVRTGVTFLLVTIAWMFFRLSDFTDAWYALVKIVTCPGKPFIEGDATSALEFCVLTLAFVVWHDLREEFLPGRMDWMNHKNIVVRYMAYIGLTLIILTCGVFDATQFIYAQY